MPGQVPLQTGKGAGWALTMWNSPSSCHVFCSTAMSARVWQWKAASTRRWAPAWALPLLLSSSLDPSPAVLHIFAVPDPEPHRSLTLEGNLHFSWLCCPALLPCPAVPRAPTLCPQPGTSEQELQLPQQLLGHPGSRGAGARWGRESPGAAAAPLGAAPPGAPGQQHPRLPGIHAGRPGLPATRGRRPLPGCPRRFGAGAGGAEERQAQPRQPHPAAAPGGRPGPASGPPRRRALPSGPPHREKLPQGSAESGGCPPRPGGSSAPRNHRTSAGGTAEPSCGPSRRGTLNLCSPIPLPPVPRGAGAGVTAPAGLRQVPAASPWPWITSLGCVLHIPAEKPGICTSSNVRL